MSKAAIQDALNTMQRQSPCPHETIDRNLGAGNMWAKCEDCGVTIQQDSLARAKQYSKQFDEALLLIRSALVQQAQAGWQLVPVEPTEAMLDAARACAMRGAAFATWNRMLAAAPKGEKP